jgi:hypothetical protein
MHMTAEKFLLEYAALFLQPVVSAWKWDSAADDDFGKSHSWPVLQEGHEINAAVDLQWTQLQLSISDRDVSPPESPEQVMTCDTHVVFDALVQFEDGRIVWDGAELPLTAENIAQVIAAFNARAE